MMAHPLQEIVLGFFNDERPAHDATTISYCLAGGLVKTKGGSYAPTRAYKTVARDVLGCLEEQGLVVIDALGWHRRTWRRP
jgi:hypothetical protein